MRLNAVPLIPLQMRYRPAQPHGWPASGPDQAPGRTLGGHRAYKNFTYAGKAYRVSLLDFTGVGDAPDPTFLEKPTDSEVAFRRTLTAAFGTHYAFLYRGGSGRHTLTVESYSVSYAGPGRNSPGASAGADLYVVADSEEEPRGARQGILRWIQVVRATGSAAAGKPGRAIDNLGRANPFYMYGGRVSINGASRVNFYCSGTVPLMAGPPGAPAFAGPSGRFVAETFLVRDTKTRDAAGKDVIEVYGGLRYGWQIGAV